MTTIKPHESFTELQNEETRDYFFRKYSRPYEFIINPSELKWKWYEDPKKPKTNYKQILLKWLGWI